MDKKPTLYTVKVSRAKALSSGETNGKGSLAGDVDTPNWSLKLRDVRTVPSMFGDSGSIFPVNSWLIEQVVMNTGQVFKAWHNLSGIERNGPVDAGGLGTW